MIKKKSNFVDMPKSYPLLEKAPPHDSPEFLDYLRENNKVVSENKHWLIIENCKYHKAEAPWLTAFHVGYDHWTDCVLYLNDYIDWKWIKKAKSEQTIPGRFHIHLVKE